MKISIYKTLTYIFIGVSLAAHSVGALAQSNAVELFDQKEYKDGQPLSGLNGGIGWAGAWSGEATQFMVAPQGGVSVSNTPAAMLRSTSSAQFLTRRLALSAGGDGTTLWLSFSIQQQQGNSRMGILLSNHGQEALYIGTEGHAGKIVANSTRLGTVSATAQHRLYVRIDFRKDADIAYVFADAGESSEPDVEGAAIILKGRFRFDALTLLAAATPVGQESVALIGPIRLAGRFQDVLMGDANQAEQIRHLKIDYHVTDWKKQDGAVLINTPNATLRITPYIRQVIEIEFGDDSALNNTKSFAVSIHPEQEPFTVNENTDGIKITTAGYLLIVDKKDTRLRFCTLQGSCLLEEAPEVTRTMIKADGQHAPASVFQLTPNEPLYGLGQYRDGVLNLRGQRRELVQINTQIAMPVLLSTGGWGMFWDNPSRTIFQDNSQGMQLSSDYGRSLRYFVFIGQNLDSLVSGYRRLTGQAPMLPEWALGYHQSRNKYATQGELIQVAERMRDEHIPFNSIFIDYYYWGKYGTGSHHFDEQQFPDLPAMMDKLHNQLHTKVIATVWPAFKPGSPNYEAMARNGYLLNGVKALDGYVYDPFNPKAAALYWSQVKSQLLPTQIDGWFLDGPEPDNVTSFLNATTYLGPAPMVRNLFPLFHSTNFYHGLVQNDSSKRYYLLTRSAWASQQKNGTVIWSGDIGSTFSELKKQIVAGLDFTASGIPYWTTDIGGYSGGNPADSAYREVFTRWWEYGAFCPIFRSHGRRYPGDTRGANELWAFGNRIQEICTAYDDLRYRLLPYIYSLTARVTFQNYTPMRLLAFDFPADADACTIKDQFMYGPAFLVCPVTDAGATSRQVYLPKEVNWIDFWSGKQMAGGSNVQADAPLDKIPLYIKAGSIIPFSPLVQYIGQSQPDPIELRVYPGADGRFELYEDDGTSTSYRHGQYLTIPIIWNDNEHTLTIGKCVGSYPGMLKDREFTIVVVGPGNGCGIKSIHNRQFDIHYSGIQKTIKCN